MNELLAWLRSKFPNRGLVAERGDDPPDFWLSFNETERLAVEVTQLLNQDERTVANSLAEVVEAAERAALSDGCLIGEYVVEFNETIEHYFPSNKSDRWIDRQSKRLLEKKIVEFISNTKANSNPSPQSIGINSHSCCRITKRHPEGALVGWVGFDSKGGWESEIYEQSKALLKIALKKKVEDLVRIEAPTILVIYDLFALADETNFRACVREIPDSEKFALIYIVQDEGQGFAVDPRTIERVLGAIIAASNHHAGISS